MLDAQAAAAHLRQAVDGLTALEREGKLAGRPRDRKQLLQAFTSELAACEAVAASPGDLNALRSNKPPLVFRLLRIRAGLLAAAGRLGELPATIDALCAMDAQKPDDLFQLARCLAWCAGRLEPLTATSAASKEFDNLKTRAADRAGTLSTEPSKAGSATLAVSRLTRFWPRFASAAGLASSPNLLERAIQDRVLRPVAIVEVPPLKLKNSEPLSLHRPAQELAVPARKRRAAGIVRIRARREFIIAAHHFNRQTAGAVIKRQVDRAAAVML